MITLKRNLKLLKLVPFGTMSFWHGDRLFIIQGRTLPNVVQMPDGQYLPTVNVKFQTSLLTPGEVTIEQFLDKAPDGSRIADALEVELE